MKKLITLILGIAFVYSCSKNTDSNENTNTTLTDIDGNVYQTVVICNQTWTKTNLNVSKYRNGNVIPQVTSSAQWAALTTGAWCYYSNDSSNGTTYGKIYNWYAVNDPRGLAPVGYHIPSDTESSSLINCLGGANIAGGAIKEIGTGINHWTPPNLGATNSSGFSGLPAGFRYLDGTFTNISQTGYWWTSSEFDTTTAWNRYFNYYSEGVFANNSSKRNGFSVRCIKD